VAVKCNNVAYNNFSSQAFVGAVGGGGGSAISELDHTETVSVRGRKYVTGKIGNIVLLNSGFRMRKNFSENYLEFGNAP